MRTKREENLLELAGAFSAFTLLGMIALWGGRVFYPFWLICATIHLYRIVKNYTRINRNDPAFFVALQILFYTVMSPFYFLMDIFYILITIVDVYIENKKVRKENERKT